MTFIRLLLLNLRAHVKKDVFWSFVGCKKLGLTLWSLKGTMLCPVDFSRLWITILKKLLGSRLLFLCNLFQNEVFKDVWDSLHLSLGPFCVDQDRLLFTWLFFLLEINQFLQNAFNNCCILASNCVFLFKGCLRINETLALFWKGLLY